MSRRQKACLENIVHVSYSSKSTLLCSHSSNELAIIFQVCSCGKLCLPPIYSPYENADIPTCYNPR